MDERQELLLKNQNELIEKLEAGPYAVFLKKRRKSGLDEKNLDALFEDHKKRIKGINSLRIRRFIQTIKRQTGLNYYLLKHMDVAKSATKMNHLKPVYLSVACIIKNEAPYIKEWLEFHLNTGVERFFVFDNDSDDNIKCILQPYIDKGQVIYFCFPGSRVQVHAYNLACRLSKKCSRWLALIDADEFLFPVQEKNLRDVLKNYEQYPGVGVNWVVYGPCQHETKPEGFVTENYRLTFEDKNNVLNCRIKSIVNPEKVMAVLSPHHSWYKNGSFAVDETREEIVGEGVYARMSSMTCTVENHTDILRINHYWTKSKEELRKKCQRGYPDGNKNPEYDSILKRLDYPLINDYIIEPFVDRMKSTFEK